MKGLDRFRPGLFYRGRLWAFRPLLVFWLQIPAGLSPRRRAAFPARYDIPAMECVWSWRGPADDHRRALPLIATILLGSPPTIDARCSAHRCNATRIGSA